MALVDKLRHLLAEGGFDLRQWASNDSSIINHQPTNVEVSFIAARSRVTPKKQLELCATTSRKDSLFRTCVMAAGGPMAQHS